MSITIKDILVSASLALDPLDCELIIAHVLGKTREFVLTHPEHELAEAHRADMDALLKRRINHEPLAHILGHREFFGLDFKVTPDTLIPRPETELMVEEVLCYAESRIKNKESSRDTQESGIGNRELGNQNILIVDVGTGSGCIITSIAHELLKLTLKNAYTFLGVDTSSQALAVARDNALKHGLEKNILFIQSDLLENIFPQILSQSIDTLIIAANLPYLSHTIYRSSMPDVQNFEPKSALVSEEDGLRHYRRLLEQIRTIRTEKKSLHIRLFFEISPEQNITIENLICKYFPQANMEIKKDLAGKYRLAIAIL